MTIAIIIQARIGSSRLPAKVLLPLPNGKSVVEHIVYTCAGVEQADAVVLAVPECDAEIINKAMWWPGPPGRSRLVVGSEDDVLARYAKAAAEVDADTIVRITADCPMIDPATIAQCIKLHRRTGADYTSNAWPSRSFPHGWDCEVFSRELLDKANAEVPPIGSGEMVWDDEKIVCADSARYDREHVTPWMQRNAEKKAFLKSHEDRSHIRCTLDTIEDYRNIWEMMANAA